MGHFLAAPTDYRRLSCPAFPDVAFGASFEGWANVAATVFEIGGVVAVVVGAVVAVVAALRKQPRQLRSGVREFRQQFGGAIVLGLEVMVAADILRTISATPTPREVAVLAAIVLIRTFLSWSLEVELEGRWPWQGKS